MPKRGRAPSRLLPPMYLDIPSPHPDRRRGSVLLLVLIFTSLLATIAASYGGTLDAALDVQRDESRILHAEFAAESGVEYARRQLLLDPDWAGTGVDGLTLPDGMTRFVVAASQTADLGDAGTVHGLEVDGIYDDSRASLGGEMTVTPGTSQDSQLALIFLGEDFKQAHGMVYGDVLVTDRANKVNDWVFDAQGVGSYQPGGAAIDGKTQFICTGVDGTLYKYRDDVGDYNWLGDEVVLTENTRAPAWDLDDFLEPGPGKVIFTDVTRMDWEYYEETVVFVLEPGQKLTLRGCVFAGGVVVYCPKDYDLRQGYRNMIQLKDQTCIGGGDQGVEPNIGLIAPGGKVKNDCKGTWMCGFHFLNEIGKLENSTILGQLVVLNRVQMLKDSDVIYYEPAALDGPSMINFGSTAGKVDITSLFEDFN